MQRDWMWRDQRESNFHIVTYLFVVTTSFFIIKGCQERFLSTLILPKMNYDNFSSNVNFSFFLQSTASVSGSSISHASQLSNPYLGLPLEFGKCESCGSSDPGNCEGAYPMFTLVFFLWKAACLIKIICIQKLIISQILCGVVTSMYYFQAILDILSYR